MAQPRLSPNCQTFGHMFLSYVVSEIVDPVTKAVIRKYEIICSTCGNSRVSILSYRPRASKKGKDGTDRKETNQNSNVQPAGRAIADLPDEDV